MEYSIGDLIWIYPHDELSWCPGEICKIGPDSYLVVAIGGDDDSLYRVEKKNAIPVHPSCLEKVSNLLQLGEFNEGSLLHNIRARYLDNQIYTSVGTPILISLNPYTKLPIYSKKNEELYRGKSDKETNPHLYLMAEKAYAALKDGNQSIIISGESGSGKTEAAKIILSYLAGGSTQQNLSKQVLDTNPILEAFGNAKTLKNDNSSRFGKFIEIHFDNISYKLLSARIQNYLLEKSRIVSQQVGERNYHFFYQLCKGASEEEKRKYNIGPLESFNYLNQSECVEIEGVDDIKNYLETRECMNVLGFSQVEQDGILRVTMGVLHLGNLEFAGDDQAVINNKETLYIACDLLGLSFEALSKVLTTRVIIDPSNNKEIIINQTPSQAYYTRDATAKAIYSKLFSWLVQRINKSIFIPQKKPTKIIGLLDIYGFEVFETNSFEQFCINYANEKLQQHFNHHMFKQEQAEYSKEKIKWDHIQYEDNQECIDLIEKIPIGVISLLDEQCKLQKGTDKQFLSNLYSKLSNNSKLKNPGAYVNDYFGVGHYAGDVFYNVSGFLDKNKDSLNPQLLQAIEISNINIMCEMFAAPKKQNTNTPGSLSALTLATQFKLQLHDLIKAISGSTPTYIRCIKPNSEKMPKLFDSNDVERQLRCAGMLECIRIRKAGYSVRRGLKEFIEKYSIITRASNIADFSLVNQCKNLINEFSKHPALRSLVNPEKRLIQMGISMVFMKDELRQALDTEYTKAAFKYAVKIQKNVRMHMDYKKYTAFRKAALKLQSGVRNWLSKRNALRQKKMMQALLRSIVCRRRVSSKAEALKKVVGFLGVATSRAYLEYFQPVNRRDKEHKADSISTIETPRVIYEEPPDNKTEERSRRSSISKELHAGKSLIQETLQREIKTLSYLLTREKEKNKSYQEETEYYKNLYQFTLSQLQTLQTRGKNQDKETGEDIEASSKTKLKEVSKEIKSRDNEISLLTLKVNSLVSALEEAEALASDLKKKEKRWKRVMEEEIAKHSHETQELKRNLQNKVSEKVKNETLALEKEIRSLKLQVRALENTKTKHEDELYDLNIKLTDYKESESLLKSQLKSLQQENFARSEKYSIIDSEANKLMLDQLSTTQQALESSTQALDSLQDSYDNLVHENQKLLSSENFYKLEIQKYQKQSKEKQLYINDLENQIDSLHQDKIELTKLKIELESIKHSQLTEQSFEYIEELKSQIEEANQVIEELENELEASKQVYHTLMTLLNIKNSELEVYKGLNKDADKEIESFEAESSEIIKQTGIFLLDDKTFSVKNAIDEEKI